MRHYTIVLSAILIMFMLPTPLSAQSTASVQLTIVPERSQTTYPGSVNLIAIVENNLDKDIQLSNLTLENAGLTFTPIRPLPATIPAQTAATGFYTIQIDQEATYFVVGTLNYVVDGQQRTVVGRAEVALKPEPGIGRDLGLILVGAVCSLLGGTLAEAIKGQIERRQQTRQQIEKALGVLIPSIEVCIFAVDNNRDAPVTAWEEVYFKEGLNVALSGKAKSSGQPAITQDIAQLYARLVQYNADKQFVNRDKLTQDLQQAKRMLEAL